MRIAITGHRDLYGTTATNVDIALRERLAQLDDGHPLVGITCLADGADQIFANAILALGGTINVITPAAEYRAGLPESNRPEYDRLLAAATDVRELDFQESNSDAHMAASLTMLEAADHLVAVWDGQPPRGPGGTADVVDAAKERGLGVTIIWPEGSQRG